MPERNKDGTFRKTKGMPKRNKDGSFRKKPGPKPKKATRRTPARRRK